MTTKVWDVAMYTDSWSSWYVVGGDNEEAAKKVAFFLAAREGRPLIAYAEYTVRESVYAEDYYPQEAVHA